MDGRLHHFEARGLYEGVTILWDRESKTIWHHITGEGLHGSLAGRRLAPIENVQQSTVAAALEVDPATVIAISDRPIERESRMSPLLARVPVLGDLFRRTMSREDTRRPSMDVGLGIWADDSTAIYYPLETLVAGQKFLFDTLAGRRVLLYYDPVARVPMAFYTAARSAAWEGKDLKLATGEVIRRGAMYDRAGTALKPERPLQVFTRWYGYALTFPKTAIYGEGGGRR